MSSLAQKWVGYFGCFNKYGLYSIFPFFCLQVRNFFELMLFEIEIGSHLCKYKNVVYQNAAKSTHASLTPFDHTARLD